MAKSAATMICFGASVIHMSRTAELGPVDPQVPYWGDRQSENEEPNWISAEEYIRSYDQLIAAASGGRHKRIEPFIQQLNRFDARFIEQLRSIQHLSEDISVGLLKSSMMSKMSDAKIRDAIKIFLSQSKKNSHGRMITASEVISCGLRVELIDLQSDLWHSVWELYVRSDWSVSSGDRRKLMETSTSAVSV
jgi:hypothetical protein